MITIIAACSKNRVLGNDNKLLWHLPEDLKRFKSLTLNNPIIMGRKTFESIGKALPGRTNIILTKNKKYKADGCLIYNNIYEIMDLYQKQNLFVIGGGEIYKMFLQFADKIELTLIDKDYDGDTYFPNLNNEWKINSQIESNFNDMKYKFISYERL